MSRLRDVRCTVLQIEEEVDPVRWEQTIEFIARLLIEQHFKERPPKKGFEPKGGS